VFALSWSSYLSVEKKVGFYWRVNIEMAELWFGALPILRHHCSEVIPTKQYSNTFLLWFYIRLQRIRACKELSTLGFLLFRGPTHLVFLSNFCCLYQGWGPLICQWVASSYDASTEGTETHTKIRLSGAQRELTPGFAVEFLGSLLKNLRRWNTTHMKPWWNWNL
jgi:hypothetical protein